MGEVLKSVRILMLHFATFGNKYLLNWKMKSLDLALIFRVKILPRESADESFTGQLYKCYADIRAHTIGSASARSPDRKGE